MITGLDNIHACDNVCREYFGEDLMVGGYYEP
jgi:hypothetical protein